MENHSHDSESPAFVATSTSARQLFMLLRCISFGDKVQMHISDDGVRFSVEDSSVMEGALWNRNILITFIKVLQV
jgi:cell cycle checkpoint protein